MVASNKLHFCWYTTASLGGWKLHPCLGHPGLWWRNWSSKSPCLNPNTYFESDWTKWGKFAYIPSTLQLQPLPRTLLKPTKPTAETPSSKKGPGKKANKGKGKGKDPKKRKGGEPQSSSDPKPKKTKKSKKKSGDWGQVWIKMFCIYWPNNDLSQCKLKGFPYMPRINSLYLLSWAKISFSNCSDPRPFRFYMKYVPHVCSLNPAQVTKLWFSLQRACDEAMRRYIVCFHGGIELPQGLCLHLSAVCLLVKYV